MADTPEEIQKHLGLYWMIGAVLFACTVITWLVAKFDLGAPGIDLWDFVLGLSIATAKASFVALIFMHLKGEKSLIYKILLFTFIFPIIFEGFYKSLSR